MKRQFSAAGVEDFDNMPLIKRSRRSSKKTRKTRYNRQSVEQVPTSNPITYMRNFDPFPATMKARLRYSTVIILNPGALVTDSHLFRANGIFDPDQTGTGHQPYGRDTYASIYNHYRVLKSTISMTSSTSINGIFGISLKDDTTVETNYDTIREAKGTKYRVAQLGATVQPVRQTFLSNYYVNKSNQDAPMGASPGDPMFYQCWYEGLNEIANPNTNAFVVNIVYDVLMWELRDLGQS